MHWLELKVTSFLQKVQRNPYVVPQELLEKFGQETTLALVKQFQREQRDFNLYPSNVGKPLCVLQMDKQYGSGQGDITRNLIGELVEDIVLFLLHASGVKVVAEQAPIKYKVGDKELSGRLDVVVENPRTKEKEVYDIKSASDYSFRTKKEQSFKDIMENDVFGYVHQLFIYSDAYGCNPGGFIFCNKSDGSMFVLSVPRDYEALRERALAEVAANIKNINAPFKRMFNDVPETFKKRATGNRILRSPCSMCHHKHKCWPGLSTRSQLSSTSKNPKIVDYTFLKVNPNQEEE